MRSSVSLASRTRCAASRRSQSACPSRSSRRVVGVSLIRLSPLHYARPAGMLEGLSKIGGAETTVRSHAARRPSSRRHLLRLSSTAMNRRNVILGAVALSAVVAAILGQRQARRLEQRLAHERAVWSSERAALEEALDRGPAPLALPPRLPAATSTAPGPREIIARLQALPAGGATGTLRQAVYWLEELTRVGPAALPAIQDFLATQRDRDLDVGWLERGRGWRDTLPGDFVAPPSLRLGIFDVARRIGGHEAEELLGVALSVTERGLELAFLTRLLHEAAPGRYREVAVTAARQLLASPASPPGGSPLDANHRAHLYTVLAFYGDGSFASQAEA